MEVIVLRVLFYVIQLLEGQAQVSSSSLHILSFYPSLLANQGFLIDDLKLIFFSFCRYVDIWLLDLAAKLGQ